MVRSTQGHRIMSFWTNRSEGNTNLVESNLILLMYLRHISLVATISCFLEGRGFCHVHGWRIYRLCCRHFPPCIFPVFFTSFVVMSGAVSAYSCAKLTRRPNLTSEIMLPHWLLLLVCCNFTPNIRCSSRKSYTCSIVVGLQEAEGDLAHEPLFDKRE